MIFRIIRNFVSPKTPQDIARKIFFSIKLKKSDITIDCGANIGEITKFLSKSGATVYAFEPNPHAFAVLRNRFAKTQNVHCIQKGVDNKKGRMRLYSHENSDQDEVYWSTGSSLLSFKRNVLSNKFVEVEVIDLCEFIQKLNHRVKILKMDIEGVECGILAKLINTGTIEKIDYAFVETHDDKIPEILEETNAVRELIKERKISNINLDWI